jgi:flagellar biosynthetic protein FliP
LLAVAKHRQGYCWNEERTVTKESTKSTHHSHAGSWRSWLRFLLHFGEMVVVMYLGMVVLDMPCGMVVSALGHPPSEPVTAAMLMTFTMTVPMVLWMRVRGHSWERSGEMGAVMVIPSLAIVALAIAGVISRDGLAGTVMYPMIPAMLALMLYRRSEYAHCGTHNSEAPFHEDLELAG